MMFHKKTQQLLERVKEILAQYETRITVRQVYYRLVAAEVIPNSQKEYAKLDVLLTKARKVGAIDGNCFVDSAREPKTTMVFSGLTDFLEAVRTSYKRDVWKEQDEYVEVWLEKEALASVFEPVCEKYRVPLQVMRGYASYTCLKEGAQRFNDVEAAGKKCSVLWFSDFDGSGLDMERNAKDQFAEYFSAKPVFQRVALTKELIEKHELPSAPAKKADNRTARFISVHGDGVVELDALPPNVLVGLIEAAIREHYDQGKAGRVLENEASDQARLNKFLGEWKA